MDMEILTMMDLPGAQKEIQGFIQVSEPHRMFSSIKDNPENLLKL